MTQENAEQLDDALAELTVWPGPAPELWRRALAASKVEKPRTASRWRRVLLHPVSATIAACFLVAMIGVAINASLDASRSPIHYSAPSPEPTPTEEAAWEWEDAGRDFTVYYVDSDGDGAGVLGGEAPYLSFSIDALQATEAARWPSAGGMPGSARASGRHSRGEAGEQPRQIVSKANIEIATGDVRAVFLKAAHVLSEAEGEYVQESSVTGSGNTAQASLTLRVAAHRLSDVLNALRELGEVRGEQVTGEDVTARVVDVEARLRNEQRVETELLELLEKRGDAPLREILDLRRALSEVRERIEQLTAQRQHLGRLVSLATVLVIIRPDTAQPEVEPFTIGQYFADGISSAWRKGLTLLADTCAFVVSVLVGGLIWWILLAVVIVAVWRYSRRAAGSTTRS